MTAIPAGLATALLDRYRIERELGAGGMATVYLAHDLKHGRDVALKVLRPELAAVLGRERFLAEIRLTAKLDHPHILTLIDSGESGGVLWYVLPYIRGESLRRRLDRERQLGLEEALTIAGDVAGALGYAHAQGIIHRDVKPENILLHEGEAMLTDFGIALAVREAGGERLTETGLSIGTPQYMSPEQATAERQLDARSDVYSLGAVLYEMLAGEPPFTGPTGQAVIAKLMTERPTRLRTVRDTVPEGVDLAVARALAKVPADRFPHATAFAAALNETPPSPTRPGRLTRRRVVLALGSVAFIALVALGGQRLVGSHRGRDPELVALYQRALHAHDRRTASGTFEAIKDFSAVVQRDSTYAAGWAGLTDAYTWAYRRHHVIPGIPRDSLSRLALWAADRALAADRRSPQAWLAQATVRRMVDPTDNGPVLAAARQALALDSSVARAWHVVAVARAEDGDLGGAIAAWRRSIAVDSTFAEGYAFLSLAYYWGRQYDSAAAWADSVVAHDPTYLLGRTTAGFVAIERGDYPRAAAAFDAAARLDQGVELVNALAGGSLAEVRPGHRPPAQAMLAAAESLATAYSPPDLHNAVYMSQAYLGMAEPDRALAWLERYKPRADLHFQFHLRCDPPFDPIAADPRFSALLTRPRPPLGRGC
jgi:tetratricopeptide (TPR) repeat protein